ncbi:MAG: ATP synthase subunit I [Candidatus Competibacteraceae bacterium]
MTRPEPFAGAKRATKRIVVIQTTITLLAAVACLLVNVKAAYSAVVGGGISIIATLYFARQVFSLPVGTPPEKIATRFYLGEALKIGLTVILFSIAIVGLRVSFLPLFLTYAATLMAYWLVLLITDTGKTS